MSRLFKKFAKYILLPIIGILLLILLSIVSYRWYLQSHARDANKIISPSGIESLEKIKIGGIEQWIYIRGEDKTKPLLLFLHGGPGSPEMPFAQKKFQGNLERAFVVVHWDQRGAGKSYSSNITADQLQIENFIADTKELTQILLGRFKQPRLFWLVTHGEA